MSLDESTGALAARLQARVEARDALLERITIQLAADSRVVAAWLFGSLGRQSADGLSDIDLWLVIEDAAIDAVAAVRWDYAAQVAAPLMVYDGPQNAPAGGAYLMALYPGPDGPFQIDWYWQPRALARRPKHVQILFDRVGIPAAAPLPGPLEPREPQDPEERAATVTRIVSFFWVMANIAAKSIARQESWGFIGTLGMLEGVRQQVRWLVGDRTDHPGFGPEPPFPPPVDPFAQLALLRQLTAEMIQLSPHIERVGGTIPHTAIPEIYRFHDFISMIISRDLRPRT
ncbi:MAG TPA: nucleotidyltransferase domain-containing protein [Chloroflexota bacterium]|nr:nucleotidyltransferase domain-containing protein [Chloroflexota bacterium]